MGEINPSRKEVNEYFKNIVAKEFGEKIEFYDADNYTLREIIDKYTKEGWTCWGVVRKINIKKAPKNKEMKIIGLGKKFIIFVRQIENKH